MAEIDRAALAAEVERTVQAYNAAFIEANEQDDPSLMLPWLRIPFSRFPPAPGSASTATTTGEAEAIYRAMVDGLKDTGYEKSILGDFDVEVLNPATAIARCHGVRLRHDGSPIVEFDTAYLVTHTQEGWRIAALISRR